MKPKEVKDFMRQDRWNESNASAYDAWKAEAQRTVDNAHMRYYIAHIHRLRDEEAEASSTEELG